MGVSASRMAGFGGALHRWLFEAQPVQALVAARIVFGASIFFSHLARIPDALTLYGTQGLPGARWFPLLRTTMGNFSWDAPAARALEQVLPPISDTWILSLFGLLILSSLCFTVGLRTRLSGFVTLIILAYFVRGRNPFVYWGWATFMQGPLLYVILSASGRYLSLDDWLARRRSGEPPSPFSEWLAPAWPLRLLQVNTCTMYAVAGLARLADPGWLAGQTTFNAMANGRFSRLIIDWQWAKPIFASATYVTYVLEPLAPFVLWIRRIGPIWAYALIAFHTMLELTTNIGWWSFIMIGCLASFVPKAHLEAVLAHVPGAPSRRSD